MSTNEKGKDIDIPYNIMKMDDTKEIKYSGCNGDDYVTNRLCIYYMI